MQEKRSRLKGLINEIYDLSTAQALLGWDQHTYMPSGGAVGRGYQMAALAKVIHAKQTSAELGDLLVELSEEVEQPELSSDDGILIKLLKKEYDKNLKIDPRWVEEMESITAQANMAWRNARESSDFDLFKPWLERVLDLAKRYAGFFSPYKHIYDPLLDEFEPGMTTSDVQTVFNALRPLQVDLIRAITDKKQVEDGFLYQKFPIEKQREFIVLVLSKLGYNWEHGRMDTSAHPFTNGFGTSDVRITTRFDPENLRMALLAGIHECGHALYEQGFSSKYERTPLAQGASAAFHESQSRLYENLVARSLPFWKYFYPQLQQKFPDQLGNVRLMSFYRGMNQVQPSLIRVQADEATYNLHIMLRMELEIAMMEGSLSVGDLPDAWNQRMQAYLGITPTDVSVGVLQDIHWSMGLMGYFPTYALGNLISAQLWERMERDLPDIDTQMEKGDFVPLLEWLRVNVHAVGKKLEPRALIQQITGSTIEADPYMRYLRKKYSEIYQL